ncbi:MAG: DNA topoisomerase 3 [Flavobacteriales bacterium]|jgi:DNA topoisomerase-3|nr:DNA topoisomerase 3 [Flavobacteriales bacterium]
MKLCIAEKPSVAKDIAQVIGAKSRMDGYYEGNGYLVSWTFGHLCELNEPHEYTEKWKYWDLKTLPMIPAKFSIKVKDDSGIQKQFNTIKNLVERCEEVINCGDAGQEGELIQRWVLTKSQSQKPLKRLWISSLTEEAIKEGFENLEPGEKYNNLYAAGSARAIGDWLLGMNATRLFTLRFAKKGQVLSIGRVQTPTLAMIVKRQLEIENFVSTKYWELKTEYRGVLFSSTKGKIKTLEKGEEFIKAIQEEEFEIVSYTQKEGKELPPRLFDLTSLQVEANKKIGLSAEQTLNTIQNLYEKKLVTYPRVDTTYLPDDIYPKIPGILNQLTHYSRFTEALKGKKIRKSKKVFDNKKVTDHHAIIPTGVTPSGITPQEQKIYDMITRRFIAVFYPDCIVSNTTVLGKVQELDFKATGRQILDKGWRIVFEDDSKAVDEDKKEQLMPTFEQGERGPHKPQLQEKDTRPPAYYTEATLLRAMETAGKQVDDDELRDLMKENGIGRPSTRANIIETILRRNYIKKEKKRIVATQTGVHLISLINNELLKSAELTGQWERKLREIEKGAYKVDDFKQELFEMVNLLVHEVKHQPIEKMPTICPKCNKGHMLRGKTAWGCSDWKNGCKFTMPFQFKNIQLSSRDMESLIQDKKSRNRYRIGKSEDLQYIVLTDKLKLKIEE